MFFIQLKQEHFIVQENHSLKNIWDCVFRIASAFATLKCMYMPNHKLLALIVVA